MSNNNKRNDESSSSPSFWSFLTEERHSVPSLIQDVENDQEYNRLRQQLTQCTDKSSKDGVVRALGASAVSVPFCYLSRSFLPLFVFSVGAIAYDLFASYRDCKKQRDALDLHLLKMHKIRLHNEKQVLLMRKRLLLGQDTGDDNDEDRNSNRMQ